MDASLEHNMDASLEQGSGRAYGGGLIRDEAGSWRHGFVANIGVCSILLAEIWCIFHGLEMARTLGLRVLEVESDNFLAVATILGHSEVFINCRAIVKRIRRLIQDFNSITLRHVHREENFVVDFLSHHAYMVYSDVHVLETPPTGLNTWLLHDSLDVSYLR